MNKTFYTLFLLLFIVLHLTPAVTAQEMVLVVERCKALNQKSPINNIWVDKENIKWVSNGDGLHRVLAIDLVQKVSIPAGTTSLLTIRGGNANIEWNTSEMQAILGGVEISSASYDPTTKSIWIGTQKEGAFQVSVSPLTVMQQFNIKNKKLTSNQINDIYIQKDGKVWIATDDGMLSGSGSKWSLEERYLNFVGVDAWGDNLWILGDDFLWQVDRRGKWNPIPLELKNVEGKLRDIAVDARGRIWIASNMMTGYDVELTKYQEFGPGQYFTSQYVNCLDVDSDGSIWTGTDDKGLYLIQWESAMTVNIVMDTPLDCKNSNPVAVLSAKVIGGEAPRVYQWSTGANTEFILNLAAGKYSLTVTDGKGIIKNAEYEIPDPSMSLSIEIVKPSSGATEGDASANLLVDGGTGNMTYQWDNGETTQLATKLTTGIHSVTVTDDNGCSATTSFEVTEKVLPLSVTLEILAQNKCASGAIGEIEAMVKGGKSPFKYQWSENGAFEKKLTNRTAGEYSVTVADAAGQTATGFATITAPPTLEVYFENLSASKLGVDNGRAQVKVAGGKAPYIYLWDNKATSDLVKNLSAGTHTLTITDANGCTDVQTVDILEDLDMLGVIIKPGGQINCAGQATGSLLLDISGGKGPYTYLWSDGQTTDNPTNLKAGSYSVTVTDVVGSTFSSSFEINEPSAVTANATADAPSSTNGLDGKATVKASGGTGSYSYAWDNGESSNKASTLDAGRHTVTVTDAAGCSTTATVEIRENILAIAIAIKLTADIKCAGSSDAEIDATVNGGKGPYTYLWSDGQTSAIAKDLKAGSYVVTITDAVGSTSTSTFEIKEPSPITAVVTADAPSSTNGLDGKASVKVSGGTSPYTYAWDNGETSNKAVKLPAGIHTLTVTDAAGCTTTTSIDISENILALSVLIEQSNNIKCAGASEATIAAAIKGGKGPFTYSWSSGATSSTVENLGGGLYTLTVTDITGHTATSVITVDTPKPLVTVVKIEKSAGANLKDGQATVEVTGGTGKYTYAWDTGELSSKATTLGAGTHRVTVTDENGCMIESSVVITENILPLSVSVEQVSDIKCAGQTTGGLMAKVVGGKSPYSIQWKGPAKTYTGESISQLAAGQYAMQVEDVNGTSATASFEIAAPKPLEIIASNISPANTGDDDGSVTLTISGGTGKYTLEGGTWPAGALTNKFDLLKPGEYVYTITDEAGCSAQTRVTITEDILPLSVAINQTEKIVCAGSGTASLEATPKGGKGPFTYAWSNAKSGASLFNLSDGNFKVTVTDITGQKAEAAFEIEAPKKLIVGAENLRSATNDRIKDGKGQVEIKGGTAPFSYLWSSGETTAQASQLSLGSGTVVITDANGCSASAQFEIKEKVLPELTAARLSSGEPIRMEKIQFDADSIVIREDAKSSIDELYEFLYDNPTIIIEVSGHTNGLPADEYCDRISTARAKSVKDYLVNKGIAERRVISVGHGKRKPIATNQTAEGRKRNQRVEIRLIRIEE